MRIALRDARAEKRLSKDEITAVVLLKRAFIKSERAATPEHLIHLIHVCRTSSVDDLPRIRRYIHNVMASPLSPACTFTSSCCCTC